MSHIEIMRDKKRIKSLSDQLNTVILDRLILCKDMKNNKVVIYEILEALAMSVGPLVSGAFGSESDYKNMAVFFAESVGQQIAICSKRENKAEVTN